MQKTTAYIKSIPPVTISWNKEHTKNSIYDNNTIIESGRYNASLALAFKLARYFGVTIEELFIYEEEWL